MAKPDERQHFKVTDLKRLLTTLQKAGVRPGRIEITRDGGIAVIPNDDGAAPVTNEWDAATDAA